ncbi:MAG: hypothetical protein HS103_13640 [Anaerolineales bacterium]|nr:hypothetical protein [Anaerolineales bacterium]
MPTLIERIAMGIGRASEKIALAEDETDRAYWVGVRAGLEAALKEIRRPQSDTSEQTAAPIPQLPRPHAIFTHKSRYLKGERVIPTPPEPPYIVPPPQRWEKEKDAYLRDKERENDRLSEIHNGRVRDARQKKR